MLIFKNINKSFGDIQALKNVSFEVEKGEFVFITGHSGAGKTTLLRMILREVIPDSGEITFDGVNLNNLGEKDIPQLRQKIGVVFQDLKILPERTVRENVEVALAVIGIDQEEWSARVDQVLKLVGLYDRGDYFPAQLSGGELQRVSLARALVVNPKIVLADEPTGNLDWEISKGIIEIFEKINKEGKTILMATHNEMIVEKFKKRVIKIKNGEVVSGGGLKGVKIESKKSDEKVKEDEKENDQDIKDIKKEDKKIEKEEESLSEKEEKIDGEKKQEEEDKNKTRLKVKVEEV